MSSSSGSGDPPSSGRTCWPPGPSPWACRSSWSCSPPSSSVGLGLGASIGLADLALVSVGGGALASIPVLAATLGLAGGAVRYGWDLDNVTAPLVSSLGDVLTLPALYLATGLLGLGLVTSTLGLGPRGGGRRRAGGRGQVLAPPAPAHRPDLDAGPRHRRARQQPRRRGPRGAAHDLRRAPRAPDPRARAPVERRCARGHPVRPPVEPAPPRSRRTDDRPVARRPARPLVRRRAQRAGLRAQRHRRQRRRAPARRGVARVGADDRRVAAQRARSRWSW